MIYEREKGFIEKVGGSWGGVLEEKEITRKLLCYFMDLKLTHGEL